MEINMPGHYVQEKGAISKISKYFNHLMKDTVLIIMDEFTYGNFKGSVTSGLDEDNVNYYIEAFKGECCMENINRLIGIANSNNSKTVIGIGGGKALDVAKAVGYFSDMKTIMVPTAASTDGPCSKISVLYESNGIFKEYIYLHNNPNGVVVDTEIIANAPARLLKAGIGDALSTYFETEAGYEGEIERQGYSKISRVARVLSKECFDVIINNGLAAVKAVEDNIVNEALEQVVEAIIYLSCVGFENGSLAAAHSVANALTSDNKYNHLLHGEKVAFGTIVQMILEKANGKKLIEVIEFCKKIGLPVNMSEIGLTKDELDKVIDLICYKNQPINNMKSIFCDKEKINAAIRYTNNL